MQVRQKGFESGGLLIQTLRGDTEEHSPAVAFHQLEDLISRLLGILPTGLILLQEVREGRMEMVDHLVDALHLGLGGELAVTSVEGVNDPAASVERPGMGGYPLGAIVNHDLLRGRMNGEGFAHEVVGHGISIRIEDHHGGFGGLFRRMDRDVVPGDLGERAEFFFPKPFDRFLFGGPVNDLVSMVHPFVKGLIEGL